MTEAERELLCLVIGYRVRTQRKARHLSQSDVASGIGSQSMISLIESGRQLPPSDVLRLLATRLDDSVLESYAENLENNNLNSFNVSSQNEDDLMKILFSHRGRWYAAHERIASQLCHHYYDTHRFTEVMDLCRLIILHIQHGRALGEAYFFLGSAELYGNNFEEAERFLKKSEEYYDHLGDLIRARLCFNLSYTYTYLDIQVLALWYATKAVDIFHELNHFVHYGRALGLLGVVHVHLGRLQEAKEDLTLALEIAKRWDFPRWDKGRLLVSLAEVHILLRQLDTAKSLLNQAQETASPDDHLCLADINLFEAHVAIAKHDEAKALQFIADGIHFAELASDPHNLSQLYFLRLNMVSASREKLHLAQQAYNATISTNHHILRALAAETIANLLEETPDSQDEVKFYMQEALDSYRTYVHKNSMFTTMIDQLPIPSPEKGNFSNDTQEVAASNETDASQE